MVRGALRSHRTRLVSFSFRPRKANGPNAPNHYDQDCAGKRQGVRGRERASHDSRHTLITELAESGAGDQTIMDIAGHVSRQMLKHYSHIRMQAKREALDAVGKKQQEAEDNNKAEEAKRAQDCSPASTAAQKVEGESQPKSLQSGVSGSAKPRKVVLKSLNDRSET